MFPFVFAVTVEDLRFRGKACAQVNRASFRGREVLEKLKFLEKHDACMLSLQFIQLVLNLDIIIHATSVVTVKFITVIVKLGISPESEKYNTVIYCYF